MEDCGGGGTGETLSHHQSRALGEQRKGTLCLSRMLLGYAMLGLGAGHGEELPAQPCSVRWETNPEQCPGCAGSHHLSMWQSQAKDTGEACEWKQRRAQETALSLDAGENQEIQFLLTWLKAFLFFRLTFGVIVPQNWFNGQLYGTHWHFWGPMGSALR